MSPQLADAGADEAGADDVLGCINMPWTRLWNRPVGEGNPKNGNSSCGKEIF
jgi:hypothetical protein